jgi:hypothetical protein
MLEEIPLVINKFYFKILVVLTGKTVRTYSINSQKISLLKNICFLNLSIHYKVGWPSGKAKIRKIFYSGSKPLPTSFPSHGSRAFPWLFCFFSSLIKTKIVSTIIIVPSMDKMDFIVYFHSLGKIQKASIHQLYTL